MFILVLGPASCLPRRNVETLRMSSKEPCDEQSATGVAPVRNPGGSKFGDWSRKITSFLTRWGVETNGYTLGADALSPFAQLW